MTLSFVDALADAIVRQLLPGNAWSDAPLDGLIASSRGARRTRRPGPPPGSRVASPALPTRRGRRPMSALDLDPVALERVASAITARLAGLADEQELPLEAIEI